MKRLPSKTEVRHEIEDQVEEFLKQGGEVQSISTGTSALHNGELNTSSFGFERPRQDRTPVPEVVAAIEQRRQSRLVANKPKRTRRAPKKKVIFDDFGEPIRVVWEDD